MARLSKARRMRMIREVTKRLADQYSLKDLTLEKIASECPVATSAGTIRYHFGSLDQLLTEVVQAMPSLRDEAKELGLCQNNA